MCLRSSSCFKADNSVIGTLFPTGDEIARPVKVFVTEYYRRRMLDMGVHRRQMEEFTYDETTDTYTYYADVNPGFGFGM